MFRMLSIFMQKISTEEWRKHYLFDIIVAIVVGFLLTCLILALPLHLRLATILMVYLFIILYLVYTRGFRTAILAAFIGCAILDFWVVQPVLSITVSHVEDPTFRSLTKRFCRFFQRVAPAKRERDDAWAASVRRATGCQMPSEHAGVQCPQNTERPIAWWDGPLVG
jgi:cell division protein FtsW (lipid II flippase)